MMLAQRNKAGVLDARWMNLLHLCGTLLTVWIPPNA
jgi:hypothetical protein